MQNDKVNWRCAPCLDSAAGSASSVVSTSPASSGCAIAAAAWAGIRRGVHRTGGIPSFASRTHAQMEQHTLGDGTDTTPGGFNCEAPNAYVRAPQIDIAEGLCKLIS